MKETAPRILELAGEVGAAGFSVGKVRAALEAAGGAPVRVVIASHGGDAATSCAIHALLTAYPGPTESLIRFAGSAAVLPALAPPRRTITADGTLFVHRSWVCMVGTALDFELMARRNRAIDEAAAQGYAAACQLPVHRVLELMDACSDIDADQALSLGFVHAIAEADGGEIRPPEVWHRTAAFVVAHRLASLADQRPEIVQARGEAEMLAQELADFPPLPAPDGGWPVTSPREDAELRQRERRQLELMRHRLASHRAGAAPDPRKCPITAAWRCESCGEQNFQPPAHEGRPTPCRKCGDCMRNEE